MLNLKMMQLIGLVSLCLCLSGCGSTGINLQSSLLNTEVNAEVACSLPEAPRETKKFAFKNKEGTQIADGNRLCAIPAIKNQGDMVTRDNAWKACLKYYRSRDKYLTAKSNGGVKYQRAVEDHKKRCIHNEVS